MPVPLASAAAIPSRARALDPSTWLGLLPLLSLPSLALLLIALTVASYAWWYHAGQPVGLAATRDEAFDDLRLLRRRLAALWRWITRRR